MNQQTYEPYFLPPYKMKNAPKANNAQLSLMMKWSANNILTNQDIFHGERSATKHMNASIDSSMLAFIYRQPWNERVLTCSGI